MRSSQGTVVSRQPVAHVFSFVTNFENKAKWCEGTLQTRQTSPGPVGVGTTFHEVFRMLPGTRSEQEGTVTVYEPDRSLELVMISGLAWVRDRLTFEPVDSGTRVTVVRELRFSRFGFIEPLFKGMGQRSLDGDLARLREQLEKEV